MKNKIFILAITLLFVNSCKWDLDPIKAPNTALPEAGFSLNNNFCIAPCDPAFINLSKNATSFIWDWGDGTPQSTLGPTDAIAHTYASEGMYKVVLTASNGNNFIDYSQTVSIFGTVVPNFTIDGNGCKADCEITFQNTSTGTDSYEWDFGDGSGPFSTTTKEDVLHTYTKGGTYQVSLTATGAGSSTPATKTGEVTINFNTFEFTGTTGASVSGFEDKDRNYIIAGNSNEGSGEGKWIKLDKTGNLQYSKTSGPGTDIVSIIPLPSGEMVSTGCSNCPMNAEWTFFYHDASGEIDAPYDFLAVGDCFPSNDEKTRRGTSLLRKQNGNIVGIGKHTCKLSLEPNGEYVEFQIGTNNPIHTTAIIPGSYQFVYEAPSSNDIYVLINSGFQGSINGGSIQNITQSDTIDLSPVSNPGSRNPYSMVEGETGFAFTGVVGSSTSNAVVLFGLVDLGLTNFSKLSTISTTDRGAGHSIIATDDGGFVLTGDMTNGTSQDAFLIKVDRNGVEEWREFYGGSSTFESGRQVVQTSDGGFLVVIRAADFYVVKTDDKGKIE